MIDSKVDFRVIVIIEKQKSKEENLQMRKLGFGFMRLPILDENNRASVDLDTVQRMVDLFMEKGFTYFDTARPYHDGVSEIAIGKCLASRYPRHSFFLTNKLTMEYISKPEGLNEFFNKQLEICCVDYFDNYLLHNMGKVNYKRAKKLGAFEFIEEMKTQGKVKEIGFSFHDTPELLEQILTEYPHMNYVQLQVNYLDWDSDSIQSKKCCEVARKHGKKIIVMEPIKGGTLAHLPEKAEQLLKNYQPDMSIASWAIRFAASKESIFTVLSGMNDISQLQDNISYMADFRPLNEKEYHLIGQVVDTINEAIAIPCTACEYCVKGCPKHINIPKCFALYNTDRQYKENFFSPQWIFYHNMFDNQGKASDCIACKQCERACPQHISVIYWLKEVAKRFE